MYTRVDPKNYYLHPSHHKELKGKHQVVIYLDQCQMQYKDLQANLI